MQNPLYDQALQKQGVQYVYLERVPLDQISAERGLKNQARLEVPLDQDLVDQYAAAELAGMEFPALVVYKNGGDKYTPIDGNHRRASKAKAGKTFTDVYLVQTEDKMVIDRLTWAFNNLVNGRRLSPEESLAHAVTMVRKYGLEVSQASEEFGVPRHKIQRAIAVAQGREILDRAGVRVPATLSDDCIRRLIPLTNLGEDAFTLAVSAVAETGMNSEDIGTLLKDVGAAKTHQAKIDAILEHLTGNKAMQRRAETKGGTSQPAARKVLPREKLQRLVKEANRLLDQFPEKSALLPPGGQPYNEARLEMYRFCSRVVPLFGLGAQPSMEGGDDVS